MESIQIDKSAELFEDENNFLEYCKELVGCDTVRISQSENKMFLIIGYIRNTVNDPYYRFSNGREYDFDYVDEKTIACGENKQELLESVHGYKELFKLSEIK